jgi:uncharacterized membrane protein
MSDRGIFTAALVTAVLILAGAFVLPQFFLFECAKSLIFVAIALLVFTGENHYSYMLGIIFPPLWYLVDIAVGGFLHDFRVFFDFVAGKSISPIDTPLHALAWMAGAVVFVASLRALQKEVPEKFVGNTFWICLGISLAYIAILSEWYLHMFPAKS